MQGCGHPSQGGVAVADLHYRFAAQRAGIILDHHARAALGNHLRNETVAVRFAAPQGDKEAVWPGFAGIRGDSADLAVRLTVEYFYRQCGG